MLDSGFGSAGCSPLPARSPPLLVASSARRGGATSSGTLNVTGGAITAIRMDINWAGTSGATSVINVGGGAGAAALAAADVQRKGKAKVSEIAGAIRSDRQELRVNELDLLFK